MTHSNPHAALATPARLSMANSAPRSALVVTVLCFLAVSALLFLAFSSTVIADESVPAALGSIAGVVKNVNGEPLANVEVTLYRGHVLGWWDYTDFMTTQADGQYRFAALPIGNYRLGAVDRKGRVASTFYPAAPTVLKATDININGNQLDNIDLILPPGGRITGVVTTTAGFSLTAITVTVQQEMSLSGIPYWEIVQSVSVPSSGGAYTFTHLSANSYRICARGFGTSNVAYECYDNVYDVARATSFTLTEGSTISNVNFVLGDGADYGQISGRVTDLNGTPLANIEVVAISCQEEPSATARCAEPSGIFWINKPYEYDAAYRRTTTDSQGNYRLATLSEGNYFLKFGGQDANYLAEYYNDSHATDPLQLTVAATAQLLPVVAKQQLVDMNAQLTPAAHIQGVVVVAGQPVRWIESLMLEHKTATGWDNVRWSHYLTFTDGRYTIDGLAAGTYRVSASVELNTLITNTYHYYGYYFDPSTVDPSIFPLFTEIPLVAGETKTANITLTNGPQFEGSLSGRVTAGGAPLAGAKISLYAWRLDTVTPIDPMFYVFTDAEGRYTMHGLPARPFGTFQLGAADPAGRYATTYYTAQANPLLATPLRVEDGQTLANLDMDLPLAGAISGRVMRPTGQPVPNLLVSVWMKTDGEPSAVLVQQPFAPITTDRNGSYLVQGLPPGHYGVCFRAFAQRDEKCYDMLWNDFNLRGGQVTVTASTTTTNIDLLWGPDPHLYLPIIAR